MSDRELRVSGMKCGGCEKAVEKALGAIEGVETARADHASGRVVVDAAESVSDSALADAVRAAGYGVD